MIRRAVATGADSHSACLLNFRLSCQSHGTSCQQSWRLVINIAKITQCSGFRRVKMDSDNTEENNSVEDESCHSEIASENKVYNLPTDSLLQHSATVWRLILSIVEAECFDISTWFELYSILNNRHVSHSQLISIWIKLGEDMRADWLSDMLWSLAIVKDKVKAIDFRRIGQSGGIRTVIWNRNTHVVRGDNLKHGQFEYSTITFKATRITI